MVPLMGQGCCHSDPAGEGSVWAGLARVRALFETYMYMGTQNILCKYMYIVTYQ